ncbi:putative ribonuclease H-like domain-containing protein [Tanacetum coccineum]
MVSTANTPYASAASTPIGANTSGSSFVYLRGQIHIDVSTLPNADLPIDPNMPDLEDDSNVFPNDGIFSGAYDDEDVGAEAAFNNMDNTIDVSPIPTLRVHKDYPKGQILGDPKSANKRKNPKGFFNTTSFEDESWVEAMQEELLQFKLQKVWILVDLPFGKKAFGTKWVFRNKRDKRSIVVKNKARLMLKVHFLYGTIEEEVYVHQPPGFVDPTHPNKVSKSMCTGFEDCMHKRFQMSSMGELTFFLRLQVKQQPDGIFISQDKYVADILKKFDFCSIKTATNPIMSNKPLVKDEDGVDVDVHVYMSMIGSLMYLTASRPDIMFALEAFSDNDYGGANLDRKSTTSGCQFLSRRLISWQCKKQTIMENSTTEAEYVAAANCCGQVLWIQNQMMDYGFNFMNTKIYIDNESTVCIVKNPVYHLRTKHIKIRHHFIRDCYKKRLIDVIKIHTDANVADLLTKGFDVTRLRAIIGAELVSATRLVNIGRPTLSTARLSYCCLKAFNYGVDDWIGLKMHF